MDRYDYQPVPVEQLADYLNTSEGYEFTFHPTTLVRNAICELYDIKKNRPQEEDTSESERRALLNYLEASRDMALFVREVATVATVEWTPVSVGLPNLEKSRHDMAVLICTRGDKEGAEALYCKDGTFRWERDEDPIDDVTYWMLLPAAPVTSEGSS